MNRAYAAGFVDGEGCINFGRSRMSIFPRVLIVNTDLEILEEFQACWGGDIRPLTGRRANWKQGYCWRISWSRAVGFLDELYPYLKIKDRQASTVFAWDAIRPGCNGVWDQEALDLLRARMTWLNRKGPNDDPDPIDAFLPESLDLRSAAR